MNGAAKHEKEDERQYFKVSGVKKKMEIQQMWNDLDRKLTFRRSDDQGLMQNQLNFI